MKDFIKLIVLLATGVAVFFCIQVSVKAFQVFDISMEPTYRAGDFIMVNKLAYAWDPPARGDVIALYSPENTARLSINPFSTEFPSLFIKRVIAVAGDTVDIRDQNVFVNGFPVDEPYVMESCDYSCATQTIPDGKYFVLGDNRNHSEDSHRGWLTKREDIIGKVCLSYWHSEYPDIRAVVIPAVFLVVGVFSKDTILGAFKRKSKK